MKELHPKEIKHHLANMRESGYTILEDVIDPSLLSQLKEALASTIEDNQIGYSKTSFEGTQTIRIYNLLAYHRVFERVPTSTTVLSLVEQLLDTQLQLSSLSAICPGPGQAAQTIHGDSQLIPLPRPHVPIAINSMWALSDFTEMNGATRVVPGSHNFDHNPDYESFGNQNLETVSAEMAAGSILLWNSALWHGGGENSTDKRRDGIGCYYCAGWIRAQENQQLGLPLNRLEQFDRRLQELCGFSVYQGIYGHVDNRDPIELLGREQLRDLVWQASDRTLK